MSGPVYIFFNVILIYFHQALNFFLSSPLSVQRLYVYSVDTSAATSPHTTAHLNHTSIPGSTSRPWPVHVTITPKAHHPHIFDHPDLCTTPCFIKAAILDCLSLTMKVLDPTKCSELITHWHHVTSQISIFNVRYLNSFKTQALIHSGEKPFSFIRRKSSILKSNLYNK